METRMTLTHAFDDVVNDTPSKVNKANQFDDLPKWWVGDMLAQWVVGRQRYGVSTSGGYIAVETPDWENKQFLVMRLDAFRGVLDESLNEWGPYTFAYHPTKGVKIRFDWPTDLAHPNFPYFVVPREHMDAIANELHNRFGSEEPQSW